MLVVAKMAPDAFNSWAGLDVDAHCAGASFEAAGAWDKLIDAALNGR